MKINEQLKSFRNEVNRIINSSAQPSELTLDNAAKLLILISMYERTFNTLELSANEGRFKNVGKLSVDLLEFQNQIRDLGLLIAELEKTIGKAA
jgi:hypothetical protein